MNENENENEDDAAPLLYFVTRLRASSKTAPCRRAISWASASS